MYQCSNKTQTCTFSTSSVPEGVASSWKAMVPRPCFRTGSALAAASGSDKCQVPLYVPETLAGKVLAELFRLGNADGAKVVTFVEACEQQCKVQLVY